MIDAIPISEGMKRFHARLDSLVKRRDWLAINFKSPRWDRWPETAKLPQAHGSRVYFIDCGPYTKIGTTSRPILKRISGLSGANPFPMSLWGLVKGDGRLERQFHESLALYHHRMEWFLLDAEEKANIRSWLIANGGEFYGEERWIQ